MMCPECALLGTVRISPALVMCRCETGELATIRAPGACGKATVIPATSPLPASSSVPCVETWWGLPLHFVFGTQLTLTIRTLVTCRLGVALGAAVVLLPAGALATGAAPGERRSAGARGRGACRCAGGHGRAAEQRDGEQCNEMPQSESPGSHVGDFPRQDNPLPGGDCGSGWAASELSRSDWQTAQRHGSCVGRPSPLAATRVPFRLAHARASAPAEADRRRRRRERARRRPAAGSGRL